MKKVPVDNNKVVAGVLHLKGVHLHHKEVQVVLVQNQEVLLAL
jgi:hypothetical protein